VNTVLSETGQYLTFISYFTPIQSFTNEFVFLTVYVFVLYLTVTITCVSILLFCNA